MADTENHALRAVDLKAKTVITLAGTGKQARGFPAPGRPRQGIRPQFPLGPRPSRKPPVRRQAGTHQIWLYDLGTKTSPSSPAGGREVCTDGPNAPSDRGPSFSANFAQPSGLATDGKHLYVADSESSSVRSVDTDPAGSTVTLAGGGKTDLFTFGLVDGVGENARFQHPLGVALAGPDRLFVADTFNGVVRVIDPATRKVETYIGSGKRDPGDEKNIGFYEPGGLSVGADTLYVADTNHHRIVAVDLKTKKPRVLEVTLGKK